MITEAEKLEKRLDGRLKKIPAWEAWEAIRKLTCAVCGVRKVRELKNVEESQEIAEKICQYIYDMAVEFKEGKNRV